jgi:methylglutaconyl-CoA hydratase
MLDVTRLAGGGEQRENESMPNPITDPLVENVIVDDLASVVKLESTPEGVATVTINRPEKRNAFDALTIEGLTEAFETLHGADHVRIVFLRGEGGHFCAGGDLYWMAQAADLTEDDNRADAMTMANMYRRLAEIPAITVAMVEGAALGGGAGLVAVCDYAVSMQDARFGFPEVKLGLTASVTAPYIVNAIGPRAAQALFLTGRAFDAYEAQRIGLVQEVAADAGAMAEIEARLVRDALAGAQGAVADSKRLVWDVWGRHIDHGLLEDMAHRLARRRISDEGREGVKAFLEHRRPAWTEPG